MRSLRLSRLGAALAACIGVACAVGVPAASAAEVNCASITGSGSSLQAEQQTTWTNEVNPNTFKLITLKTEECKSFTDKVLYTATGSGQGLLEFGITGKKLLPKESGNKATLDGFIGTDDPPNAAQLTEAEEAAGAGDKPLTVPTVAAPIAIIVHLPSGCTISGPVEVSNAHLSKLFANETITWLELLGSVASSGCTGKPMVDVRSDSSGTSFSLKQYLCQVEKTVWSPTTGVCESGEGLVTDAAKWPNEAVGPPEVPLRKHGSPEVENKGSSGEVAAVEAEAGSVGYVNLANAAAKFKASGNGETLFWVQVEGSKANEFAEPVKGTEKGNCASTYTFPTGVETEALKGEWVKVHLAKFQQAGAYPICTLTYDIGWENYKTTNLEGAEEYNLKGTEVGETAMGYFEYMVSSGTGQKKIAKFYAPLPTTIDKVAEKLAEKVS